MLTGRVVQFDENRGYGFITPDDGGEDVFVHVNILGEDRWSFGPGVPVEFQAVDGERGPKAQVVRVIGSATPVAVSQASPDTSATGEARGGRPAGSGAAARATARTPGADEEEGLCDVLSEQALQAEITESLLSGTPDLTAAQVVAVRRQMLSLARRHGWTDEG